MSEFIAWDKESNFFRPLSHFKKCVGINFEGKLFNFNDQEELKFIELFKYIGKKDISGNKIYANCSIVEFEYVASDIKLIGYFTFDTSNLLYVINILSLNGEELTEEDRDNFSNWWHTLWNDKKQLIYYSDNRIGIDFKIIDTIQENKLGLIK